MSNFNSINRHAIQRNNAGVHWYVTMGNFDVAQDHFRQALESKLDTENLLLATSTGPMGQRLNEDSIEDDESTDDNEQCITMDQLQIVSCNQFDRDPSDDIDFIPYLYLRPFTINRQDADESVPVGCSELSPTMATTESTSMSLIILFNIALVHHTIDRTSRKASLIYQIAITLLLALPPPTDFESLLLHVVILNNYGVWCYENREFASMVVCFDEIVQILDDACGIDDDDAISSLDFSVKRGIFRNLNTLLME